MVLSAEVEEELFEILQETDLLAFKAKLAVEKQLTRVEHFQNVTDDELTSYGLSTPAIRRLRNAIQKREKQKAGKEKRAGNKREKFVTVIANQADLFDVNGDLSIGVMTKYNTMPPSIISRDNIELMEDIGKGTFAIVKRSIWQSGGVKINCAVKILHDMSEHVKSDLFAEISNMQKLHHHNLVRLYGVVLGDPILMVLEYCNNGSLLNRLRCRTKERLLVTRLHNYAQQIVNGMSYLESRRFVHRDLATRNVLLTNNEEVVKICDFGLMRALNENERLYIMHTQKKVPFSWCPPESLRFRQFSNKSDVWAFGVTLWELYTYGEEPWIGYKAIEVLQAAEAGEQLRIPEFCPNEIYQIMLMCWRLSVEDRPKFSHLRNMLQDIKFTVAVCRTGHFGSENSLELQPSDRVILISERNANDWFGQSVSSHKFGTFPHSSVILCSSQKLVSKDEDSVLTSQIGDCSDRVKPPLSLLMDTRNLNLKNSGFMRHQREISNPIPGSFIHTGHGDTDEKKCWGYVEKIDEIYLKNAILSNSNVSERADTASSAPDIIGMSCQENSLLATMPAIQKQRIMSVDNINLNVFQDMPEFNNPLSSSKAKTSQKIAFDDWENQSVTVTTIRKNEQPTHNSWTVEVPPAKTTTSKAEGVSSKYDSSISIPRPNRASPVQRANNIISKISRITPPPAKLEPLFTTSEVSRSSLPAVNLPIPSTNNDNHLMEFDLCESKSTVDPVTNISVPTTNHSITFASIPTQKNIEKDPFVIEENVKSLAFQTMKSIILEWNNSYTEKKPTSMATVQKNCESVKNPFRCAYEQKVQNSEEIDKRQISSVQSNEIILSAMEKPSFQPPTSNAFVKNVASDLLPPPSELLLSGILEDSSSSTSANLNGSLGSTNNSFLGNSTLIFAPPASSTFLVSSTQRNEILGLSRYQPIFAIEGHTYNARTSNGNRIRYGDNGIPILEPIPAPISIGKPSGDSKSKLPSANSTALPKIDLQDLNTDGMIEAIAKSVDFASREQCRTALLRNSFDINAAVRALKVDKLLEMGIVADYYLAVMALDASKWNVNDAANRLLSA